jgi:hypothetical protein
MRKKSRDSRNKNTRKIINQKLLFLLRRQARTWFYFPLIFSECDEKEEKFNATESKACSELLCFENIEALTVNNKGRYPMFSLIKLKKSNAVGAESQCFGSELSLCERIHRSFHRTHETSPHFLHF